MSGAAAKVTTRMSAKTAAAAVATMEARTASAPPCVLSIPTTVRYGNVPLRGPKSPSHEDKDKDEDDYASAAIRQVGCTRRVFLLRPYLSSDELHGLAYRIDKLGKNRGINSVLIATTDDDDVETSAMPTCAVDVERTYLPFVDYGEHTGFGKVWYVSGGYDVHDVYKRGTHEKERELEELLDGLRNLAFATRGVSIVPPSDNDDRRGTNVPTKKGIETRITSHVPVITVPHGLVTDGGYAFCMGTYVLATRDTTYRILNPSRGLSFDPIGLSYMLPRLGWEYDQPSADYPVGTLLALTGIEADATDMMETGLATHYMEDVRKVGMLERTLSEVMPWDQQTILDTPIHLHGKRPPEGEEEDWNEPFRNVPVGNVVHTFSVYDAAGEEIGSTNERGFWEDEDPSIVLESEKIRLHAYRTSQLVNYAATFQDALKERTVHGIIERLREIASSQMHSNDAEEREVGEVASDFVRRMEERSPLALCVVHRLLQKGRGVRETLESCMEREKRAQMKLFQMEDFEKWAKSAVSIDDESSGDKTFEGRWKHKSVQEVTVDEVEELLG